MTDTPDTSPHAYRVLARKYRPTDFASLMGQDALVRTLTNAFAAGRIAHAFMLTGVRGVGKTTTARIIAKGLNCAEGPTVTPCGRCDACLSITEGRCVDVLEMDAASRTGVDDIREIIEGVRYAPTAVRTKVYIIDEVHMLSKAAFNALLKTLEEPPPHVTFIFATTEIRKVPVTVLSRCQRFDLRRFSPEDLIALLTKVVTAENITAEPEALRLLARAADGSARDGLSLLDQSIARSGATLTGEQVRDMLGLADRSNVLDLLVATLEGRPADAITLLAQLHRDGADPLILLQDLLETTHQLARHKVLAKGTPDPSLSDTEQKRLLELATRTGTPVLARAWQVLLKGVGDVMAAPQPMAALEMLLIRLAHIGTLPTPGDLVKRLTAAGAEAATASQAQTSSPSTPASGTPSMRVIGAHESRAIALPVTRARPQPADWQTLVALVAEQKEMQLYAQLHSLVECHTFAPGRLELFLRPGTVPDLSTRLSQGLLAWTGTPWLIALATGSAHPTLAEEEDTRQQDILREAAAHPLVNAVLLAFPGSKIEAVRDLTPDDTAPLTDTSADDMLSALMLDEADD